MNLPELRDLIKKHQPDELRQIIVEMYRVMPRKLREDKHVDDMLQDITTYLQVGKSLAKVEPPVDMAHLKAKIDIFVEYAYQQYYFAPNNFIHKKDRPKWRFIVRSFILDLQKQPMDGDSGILATDLLDNIFRMVSHASHYYLFNTNDPYRSIGISQIELLDIILTRRMQSGSLDDAIKKSVAMTIESYADMSIGKLSMIYCLVRHLRSADARSIALRHSLDLKVKMNPVQQDKRKRSRDSSSDYYAIEKYNSLIAQISILKILSGDNQDAVRYFHENYRGRAEDRIHALLGLLEYYELDDLRKKEHEAALKKGIKIREEPKIVYIMD